ncbi:TPR-like protein [Rozella allomycis CSF55]|uniref:Gamma-soluble NSF attachment protein n=1 Tax=Rozella allomycis (strain CSF55) TaxID=988480 RepID=A0A4P9YEM1_ROZAC|nr:TPR-like protein [Rozella allomycis CSF55]
MRSYDLSRTCSINAADAFSHANLPSEAAKCYESAGQSATQMKDVNSAFDDYNKASKEYIKTGLHDRAAECLEKAAKAIFEEDKLKAIEAYEGALDIHESNDRGKFATDTYRRSIQLALKNDMIEKAIKILERHIPVCISGNDFKLAHKQMLSLIIILLKIDPVHASKKFTEFQGQSDSFFTSDEGCKANELLDAFEKRDSEALEAIKNSSTISFLDNEIIRVAKSLAVAGEDKKEESNGLL